MKYKMTHAEFESRMDGEGYSLRELKHLFKVVCEMDSKVRRWTVLWLLGRGFPQDFIEGISVPMLVEEGYKPMSAFIIMDWLIKDPEAAKYSLVRHASPIEMDEETAKELRSALVKEGLLTQEVPEYEDDDGATEISTDC